MVFFWFVWIFSWFLRLSTRRHAVLGYKQRYKHYVAYRQSGWLYVEYVVTLLLITVISTFTVGNYSDKKARFNHAI